MYEKVFNFYFIVLIFLTRTYKKNTKHANRNYIAICEENNFVARAYEIDPKLRKICQIPKKV